MLNSTNTQTAPASRQRYHRNVGDRKVIHINGALIGSISGNEVISTSVSKSVLDELEAICVSQGVSRSEVIRGAVVRELAFRKYCDASKVKDITVLCGYKPSDAPRTKNEATAIKKKKEEPKLTPSQKEYLKRLLASA
jgi:hypothetical protein